MTSARSEDGLTLIELVFSILILGIALAALAGTVLQSLRAVSQNEREAVATALSVESLERLQTLDWDVVGLYDNETAGSSTLPGIAEWRSRLDGSGDFVDEAGVAHELVAIPGYTGSTSPTNPNRDDRVPLPVETIARDTTSYTLFNYVVWVDKDADWEYRLTKDGKRRVIPVMDGHVLDPKLWKALGTSPTPLAYTELYAALQAGVVDGAENTMTSLLTMKFHESCKYVLRTQHNFLALPFFVSEKGLAKVPARWREVVREAAHDACAEQVDQAIALNRANEDRLKTTYNVEVYEWSEEDAAKARALST